MDLLLFWVCALLVFGALWLGLAVGQDGVVDLPLLEDVGQLVLHPGLSVDGDLGLLLEEADHLALFLYTEERLALYYRLAMLILTLEIIGRD